MSSRGDYGDQVQMGGHYHEVLLELGTWALVRKDDAHLLRYSTGYHAMIRHECPEYGNPEYPQPQAHRKYTLRNGENSSRCSVCKDPIPEEIQGLWHLLCNDQRRGYDHYEEDRS